MANDRLDEARDRIYDALEEAELGTPEYDKLFDKLLDLEKMETQKMTEEFKAEHDREKLELERRKFDMDNVHATENLAMQKRQHRGKIWLGLAGLFATLGVAVVTNKEEEFRAITSKVDQKAKDCIRFIKY